MDSRSSISAKDKPKKNIDFQLMSRANLYNNIKKIKEISGGRILILFDDFFVIINIKTKKQICEIKSKFEKESNKYYENLFFDFIELKNKDLILWSKEKIFYYKKSGDNYDISQVINELKQQRNKTKLCQLGDIEIYDLYNIIELENNILLSCNSIGIKIYKFIKKEYKLINVIPMFLDVENLIQIKDNNFLVIHHYKNHSVGCFLCSYHKFALSLFNLNSYKSINKIFYHETEINRLIITNYRFNYFLVGDNFIYQICTFPDQYELEDDKTIKNKKAILSINYNLYNIKTGNNILNLKTSFCLISYFKDNLIFAQDYESLKICYFKNNSFTSIYKFNFNNSNLCILKNNDLIIFGRKQLWIEFKDDGKTFKYCERIVYYYKQYKYLEN